MYHIGGDLNRLNAWLLHDFDEAYLKALTAVGYRFPFKNILLSTGPIESKAEMLESIENLKKMGMKFYATGGTARFLEQNKIKASR